MKQKVSMKVEKSRDKLKTQFVKVLKKQAKSKTTVTAYAGLLNVFVKAFKNDPAKITGKEAVNYLRQIRRTKSNGYFMQSCSAIRLFYRDCLKNPRAEAVLSKL